MNSCMRCGTKLQHNYLVTIFTMIQEQRKRLIVCLKCREVLNNKAKEVPVKAAPVKEVAMKQAPAKK